MLTKPFFTNFLLFIFTITSQIVKSQIMGCTDPLASNYNSVATLNDSSCTYTNVTLSPILSYSLQNQLNETSGLIYYDNYLWTHNDNSDTFIYQIDTTGVITHSVSLANTVNIDWEDIAQDSNYVYVGNFGNNGNGNRTNLNILRILKSSLSTIPIIDTIFFSYSNQTSFVGTGANQTDFDCEAFIVKDDSIYLFTKQWVSLKTSVYSLPKNPGTYSAQLKQTFDVQGLITGATHLNNTQLTVLVGYTKVLQPFMYLLYNYNDNDFFSGNSRKINLNIPFHQTEGIATKNGLKYYVSNEYFSSGSIITPQKLHVFDLENYLRPYLFNEVPTTTKNGLLFENKNLTIYPNPSNSIINIVSKQTQVNETNYQILNHTGQAIISGKLTKERSFIDISNITNGVYFIILNNNPNTSFKITKSN